MYLRHNIAKMQPHTSASFCLSRRFCWHGQCWQVPLASESTIGALDLQQSGWEHLFMLCCHFRAAYS